MNGQLSNMKGLKAARSALVVRARRLALIALTVLGGVPSAGIAAAPPLATGYLGKGDYFQTTCAVLRASVTCMRPAKKVPPAFVRVTEVNGTAGASAITKVVGTWDVRGDFCAQIATSVRCWRDDPKAVAGPPLSIPPVANLSRPSPAGYACAVTTEATVYCWGEVHAAAWRMDGWEPPKQIAGIDDAVSVAVDRVSACYIRRDGTVGCWGDTGDLRGIGVKGSKEPFTVPGLSDVKQISSFQQTWCAVSGDGSTRCWGSGFFPERKHVQDVNPTAVTLAPAAAVIHLTPLTACSVGLDRTLRCWGDGNVPAARPKRCSGSCWPRLGGISRKYVVRSPAPVAGFSQVRSFSTDGMGILCAEPASGRIACWDGEVGSQFHTPALLSYLPKVINGARGTISLR